MKVTKIKGVGKVKTIYHLADIHIRNVKRHKEYKQQFKRAAEMISKDTEDAIVVLAGDIVHSKLDLSPESVYYTQMLFRLMADLCPTFVFTGNHDVNLNNATRLDAISPIVDALNHSNLFYLKDSGVYQVNDDLTFVVMSVWDKPEDFIRFDAVPKKDNPNHRYIALHHGAVNKAQTDAGFVLTNDHVSVDIFNGYDIVLLGDIHKRQFLQGYAPGKPIIAYPGSLIQQNHAEEVSHGYLKWDILARTAEYVEVPNDYGYVTLNVKNGIVEDTNASLPPMPRIRLKVENTNISDIRTILSEIKQQYKVQDVSIQKIRSSSNDIDMSDKINLGDIRDVEFQNELIIDYLMNKFPGISDKILDGIRHINRVTNAKMEQGQNVRNVIWRPKYFKFSNMFSYGEDNYIDFTDMKGTYGLFAPNASGKSSLLDAISFTCFDKSSKTSKAAFILNNKEKWFDGEFCFELGNTDYFIKRKGVKNKNGHVKVDVDFWCIHPDGTEEKLNGEERDETNKIIRQYLGTYDDFTLTALSLQNNHTGFIDMSQRERKDLLSRFLDISLFEELYKIAAEDIKEVAVLLKQLQKQDFSGQLAIAEKGIKSTNIKIKDESKIKTELEKLRDECQEEIVKLSATLKPIDPNIADLEQLKSNKDKIKDGLATQENLLKTANAELKAVNVLLTKKTSWLNKHDLTKLLNDYNELQLIEQKHDNVQEQIEDLEEIIAGKEKKLVHLSEHKYDPNCKFCMDNVFVKDALSTKDSLVGDKIQLQELNESLISLSDEVSKLSKYRTEHDEYFRIKGEIISLTTKSQLVESNVNTVKARINALETEMVMCDKAIKLYLQYKDAIRYNDKINEKIAKYKTSLTEINSKLDTINNNLITLHGQLKIYESSRDACNKSIDNLKSLEIQYQGYEKYLESVKRDGVPYSLITKALPRIELEVNNILAQMVDFNLMLQADGSSIDAYIVYDENNYWPLELTSGMEKFVSSLAIRTSLISVSNLPRPNFIAIDEGFGNLDSENLNSIYLLFDYLKSQFDFVVTISHIDTMRDIVDNLIVVSKDKHSKIVYP